MMAEMHAVRKVTSGAEGRNGGTEAVDDGGAGMLGADGVLTRDQRLRGLCYLRGRRRRCGVKRGGG